MKAELAAALACLTQLSWLAVTGLLLLQALSLGLIGLHWTLLLRGIKAGEVAVGWKSVMLRYLGGSLIESITPSAKLGGEAMRMLLFRQRFGLSSGRLVGAMALHKLLMLAALLLVVPIAAVVAGGATVGGLLGIAPAAGGAAVIATLAAVTLALALLYRGMSGSGSADLPRRLMAGLLVIAVLIWALYPLKVALAARVSGVSVSPAAILAATFGAYALGLLPVTPGGLGTYEVGMAGILIASGIGPGEAAAVTLLSRVVTFWWPLLLSSAAALTLASNRDGRPRSGNTSRSVQMSWIFSRLLRAVVRLEILAGRCRAWGWIYTAVFYRGMIATEYRVAKLSPGSHVLVLGAGPYPMTALGLARRGCNVTAVDCNREALVSARGALERQAPRHSASGAITLLHDNGLALSYHGYDAVVVALHVQPRKAVLQRILETADAGARVVYRNPRGALCGAYRRVTPGELGLPQAGTVIRIAAHKELVMLRKPKDFVSVNDIATAGCTQCMLCDLAPRQHGTISHAPDLPALAALGLRPGKTCSLVACQPWGGPIICSIGGRQVALERSIASQIGITPLRESS